MRNNSINFIAEQDESGGFSARAVGISIFTEADTFDDLKKNIHEAVECHFEDGAAPADITVTYGTSVSRLSV